MKNKIDGLTFTLFKYILWENISCKIIKHVKPNLYKSIKLAVLVYLKASM